MKKNISLNKSVYLKQDVVITGMGVMSTIGHNARQFGRSLKAGRSGIGFLQHLSAPFPSVNIGAQIMNFSFETMLRQNSLLPEDLMQKARQCARRSPFAVQSSVLPALEAWTQAELHSKQISPDRLGIIVAGSNLTTHFQYGLYPKFHQNPEYLTPGYARQYMDTDQVGTLSEIFKIRGEGFTVGGASASGNVGILKGFQLIQAGLADACMVVGPPADVSPMELQGFCNVGAMGGKRFHDAPEKACRPFDQDHEGFIYGQASGCLVLESLESASRREVPVLAEILGCSLALDGNRLTDPNEEGEARAMELALNRAGIMASDVDYLNAHGSSSPLGDKAEIKAVREVFKENRARLWINATKSLTGHCLYSAGVIEAIAVIIQMREGFIHPNLNLDNPIDSECRFSGCTFINAGIEIAMSNSFGFGGVNSSIIIKKVVS